MKHQSNMRPPLSVLLAWVHLTFPIAYIQAQTSCHEIESCIFGSITTSSTSIDCYGHRSCEQADTITSTGSAAINCYGSYSCQKAGNISRRSSSLFGYIYCGGLSSCAETDLIINNNGLINCQGEQSCIETKIIVPSLSTLLCNGDRSCAESEIILSGSAVYFYGHLSGFNSILYSNETNMNVYFHGYDSGYNTTIICGDGHTCNIDCNGNACINSRFECINASDATSCTIDIDCTQAQHDEINCPLGYQVNNYDYDSLELDEIEMSSKLSLLNVTMSTWENSYHPCYSSDVNCGDYQDTQCYTQTVSTTVNNTSPICCTGYISCFESDNITAAINTEDTGNTAIRCDASNSCNRVPTGGFVLSKQNSAGNIYSTGFSSIGSSVSYQATIETSYDYNIFCTGQLGCSYQYIRDANNLYCTALNSCQNSPLISDINSVYGYAHGSLQDANIDMIYGNVYCGGYASCQDAMISDIHGDVYGNNYQALKGSDILDVGGNVFGLGYQSLFETTVQNATNVYCVSTDSCKDSSIRSIHNKIYANGKDALSGSVIISETNFNDNGTLFIYINGTNDENIFDIYCNETDTCKIDCQSEDACTKLALHCGPNLLQSRCYVSCDHTGSGSGINCPFSGIYKEWITETPTSYPTAIPTSMPSKVPSSQPTNFPTTQPTLYPTQLPSTIPSTIPSKMPSTVPSDIPSDTPTTIPSQLPSVIPTIVPTTVPTADTASTNAIETTSTTTAPTPAPNGGSRNSGSNNGVSLNNNIMILLVVGIISLTLIIIVGMILCFVSHNNSIKQSKNANIFREIELNPKSGSHSVDGKRTGRQESAGTKDTLVDFEQENAQT